VAGIFADISAAYAFDPASDVMEADITNIVFWPRDKPVFFSFKSAMRAIYLCQLYEGYNLRKGNEL
jgi:hypothetical protein